MEWRAYTTQIHCIEANTEKHQQEVLTTTNVIFSKKWEATHDHINHCSEDNRLLKNQVVDLKALSGLQQTALQSCQNTIAGLEETVTKLTMLVTLLEKLVCRC